MGSVLFLALSLLGDAVADCGCGQGEACSCGANCQCGTAQIAMQRKEAIKKADADAEAWKGWTKKADGWWYPPVQPRQTRFLQEVEYAPQGRQIFIRGGGRRGGC